jgi:hypothetical protein
LKEVILIYAKVSIIQVDAKNKERGKRVLPSIVNSAAKDDKAG